MSPVQLLVLVVLLFSVYLGWSLSRGGVQRIRLYAIAGTVLLALFGAALSHALGLRALVEPLSVTALALSLGALPGSPSVWEAQLRADLEATRLYRAFRPGDLRTWTAWLKLVDRVGALRAALSYLAIFGIALTATLLALLITTPPADLGFAIAPLGAPALFAILSTVWLYRAARHLIPGA